MKGIAPVIRLVLAASLFTSAAWCDETTPIFSRTSEADESDGGMEIRPHEPVLEPL